MILRIEVELGDGANMVHFAPGSVENVRILSRGMTGVIHMKSGQEYQTTRANCEAVLSWMGYRSPNKE